MLSFRRVIAFALLTIGSQIVPGCSGGAQVPAEFQGHWHCGSSPRYQIGPTQVRYISSDGDYTLRVQEVVNNGPGVVLRLYDGSNYFGSISLRRESFFIHIDANMCGPGD
jgi:hypothetical protein